MKYNTNNSNLLKTPTLQTSWEFFEAQENPQLDPAKPRHYRITTPPRETQAAKRPRSEQDLGPRETEVCARPRFGRDLGPSRPRSAHDSGDSVTHSDLKPIHPPMAPRWHFKATHSGLVLLSLSVFDFFFLWVLPLLWCKGPLLWSGLFVCFFFFSHKLSFWDSFIKIKL